jgi:hypothetical protein
MIKVVPTAIEDVIKQFDQASGALDERDVEQALSALDDGGRSLIPLLRPGVIGNPLVHCAPAPSRSYGVPSRFRVS